MLSASIRSPRLEIRSVASWIVSNPKSMKKELLATFPDDSMTRTEWAPLDRDDAQAEIGRAGVLVRQNLSSAGAGWHEAELRLPRDPGWFRLRLNFQRRGLTAVHLEEEVELVADGAAEGGPAAGFDVVVAAAPYICTLLAAMGVCLRAALCRRGA